MSLYKIIKILAGLLAVAGVIFLGMVISKGDTAIQAAAADGDNAVLDPMLIVTYIIFAFTIFLVLVFVLQNLFTNTKTLKGTLIGAGSFAGVLVISYLLSSGADASNYFYDGINPTEGETHMVSAGLVAFYILIIAAVAAMLLSPLFKKLSR